MSRVHLGDANKLHGADHPVNSRGLSRFCHHASDCLDFFLFASVLFFSKNILKEKRKEYMPMLKQRDWYKLKFENDELQKWIDMIKCRVQSMRGGGMLMGLPRRDGFLLNAVPLASRPLICRYINRPSLFFFFIISIYQFLSFSFFSISIHLFSSSNLHWWFSWNVKQRWGPSNPPLEFTHTINLPIIISIRATSGWRYSLAHSLGCLLSSYYNALIIIISINIVRIYFYSSIFFFF